MPKGLKGFQKGHKRFAGVLFKKGEHHGKEFKKGHIGYVRTEKHREQCRKNGLASKKFPLLGLDAKSKEYRNYIKKLRAHETGKYKKYLLTPRDGRSFTKEYKRLNSKKNKAMRKNAGILSIQTIQLVYEHNIKKYGTLTCYLCLKPIEFGKDNLEHKTPLSRDGNNKIENLEIACQKCNYKKNKKTEEEYRALIGQC